MVAKNLLLATKAGLGDGETPVFPVSIFKVKDGINYKKGDPNYDLFKLAIEVSAERLFPNFSFLDSPQNLPYYEEGNPESEVSYMGCRTRVMANEYDKEKETVTGRGNLSFTSINLPRIGIESEGDIGKFYEILDERMELVVRQLLHRLEIQARKKVKNFPFLMGQGVWIDSEYLGNEDSVREIIKNGSLSIGFIGLAETLKALIGEHHGESDRAQELGLEIIGYMRDFCDKKADEYKLNFTLLSTPGEGLSGRFVRMDAAKYGIIEGVTDKEWYTNSVHIPVEYPIKIVEKLTKEGKYHAFCNAGHIAYVELDGDVSKNLDAFESVIRVMKETGVGYGAINHPVDRDPICGYVGVINEECPRCGRKAGESISFAKAEEIRKRYNN